MKTFTITYSKMSNDNVRPVYVRYFEGQSRPVCGWYETGQCVMRLCAISNVCQILGVLSMNAFLDSTDDDISRGSVSCGSVSYTGVSRTDVMCIGWYTLPVCNVVGRYERVWYGTGMVWYWYGTGMV